MTTIAPPPPAPVTPPPPLSPGGRTAFRISLIALAAVLVVGTLVSLGVAAWGVAGFRVDAVPFILDAGATAQGLELAAEQASNGAELPKRPPGPPLTQPIKPPE